MHILYVCVEVKSETNIFRAKVDSQGYVRGKTLFDCDFSCGSDYLVSKYAYGGYINCHRNALY